MWRSPPATRRRARRRGWRCTTTAPRPSTPAVPARPGPRTPRGRCSCRTSSGSRWRRSTVIHGDTDLVPVGVGTYASRSLQHRRVGRAQGRGRGQGRGPPRRRRNAGGQRGRPGSWTPARGGGRCAATRTPGLSWGQVAGAGRAGMAWPPTSSSGDHPTFPFGAHVAVVEVDTETGKVRHVRHVTVDDAGPVVNPVLAEGQRHGGIAQGAAQALLEEVALRHGRQPVDEQPRRLRRDHRDGTAQLRAGRDGDAHHAQPARGQGHRGGRDDRRRPPPCRTR